MTRKTMVAVLAVIGVSLAALAAFAGGEAVDARPEAETLRIEVDLSERTLSVLDDGQVIETHPVTVGSQAHPTPRGSFRIDRVIWNPSWNPPASDWARGREAVGPGPDNPMGRVKMYFKEPTFYIHGTRDVWNLGKAASHGCVRMSNHDALSVARVVMNRGGEPRTPGWFTRVINSFRDTREVELSRPVPLTIRD